MGDFGLQEALELSLSTLGEKVMAVGESVGVKGGRPVFLTLLSCSSLQVRSVTFWPSSAVTAAGASWLDYSPKSFQASASLTSQGQFSFPRPCWCLGEAGFSVAVPPQVLICKANAIQKSLEPGWFWKLLPSR